MPKMASSEALIEIFGTPRPSEKAVLKWKAGWINTASRIKVTSWADALRLIDDSDIDPLFYQTYADAGMDKFVVFYHDEDLVYFKLHYGIS